MINLNFDDPLVILLDITKFKLSDWKYWMHFFRAYLKFFKAGCPLFDQNLLLISKLFTLFLVRVDRVTDCPPIDIE